MCSARDSMLSSRYLILYLVALYLSIIYGAAIPEQRMATHIQGPSSQSRIVGSDGSVIVADNPGGRIIHHENVGVFEPAGAFLGPHLFNPNAPGQLAHKAVDAAFLGPGGSVVEEGYLAENGSESAIGRVHFSNAYKTAVDVEAE